MNLIRILFLLVLFSCSSSNEKIFLDLTSSDSTLYNKGMNLIKKKEFTEAVEVFNELELQHPYSKWASRGQLMAGFALYKSKKYDEAILNLSKFIELNPNHPLMAYAVYLKGYSYYERMPDISLDQKYSLKASEVFSELINRFPKSAYAKKSKKHLLILKNQLAAKEMSIGKYYQEQGNYLSGIKRYKTILKEYQKTAQIPESIYRLVECYISIGLRAQALYLYSILDYNFSKTKWKKEAKDLLIKYKVNTDKQKLKKRELNIDKLKPGDFDLI